MNKKVQGIIQGWRRKIKRGEIHLDTGERFPFTFDMVTNVEKPQHIRNNMRVSAVVENDRIISVTIEGLPQNIPQPLDKPHPGEFLNPYNFVRYLEEPEQKPKPDEPDKLVLWRCPPPPHDRYTGLSGQIQCTITNVSPLFVSDTHRTIAVPVRDENGNQKRDVHGNPLFHYKYQFFTVWDEAGRQKLAIPASSLRGMLRTVYEAVTNSCFGVFDRERRLEYRERPEYGNQVKENAAIVRRLATPELPGLVETCRTATIGAYYEENKSNQNATSPKGVGVRGWRTGDEVVARVWKTPKGRLVVREFAKTEDELQPCGSNEEYVYGWLKITGKGEKTQKVSETLFLNPERHGGEKIEFTWEQQEEYNTILRGQYERRQTPAPIKSKQLQVGDLVWLEKEGDHVKRLLRVQIPRTPYPKPLNDFLPEHIRTCQEIDTLCPACRAFGWVYPKKRGEKVPAEKVVAYAGRIRIGHAVIQKERGRYKAMTLGILSTPKPTTTQFYLLNADGEPDSSVTYRDQKAKLRGRKFYRYQPNLDSREYIRAPFENPKQDHQNRTVRGVLQPGATFTFILDFENLRPTELGALLYALELEDGMYHRLGYAKPLGFGSVKITVDEVKVMDWEARLQSLEPGAGWKSLGQEKWKQYKKDFLQAMHSIYGDDFENIVLADLRALLSEPPDLPIHYPRTRVEPDKKGRNFEWFMGNRKLGREGFPLPLPQEEQEGKGLPLLDKKDNKVP